MAKRLIIISELSDETITDIIDILESNEIAFYITPAGGWVSSLESIWLKNDGEIELAKGLVNKYFQKISIESEKALSLEDINNKNTMQRILANPMVYALYIPTFIIIALMVFLLS